MKRTARMGALLCWRTNKHWRARSPAPETTTAPFAPADRADVRGYHRWAIRALMARGDAS